MHLLNKFYSSPNSASSQEPISLIKRMKYQEQLFLLFLFLVNPSILIFSSTTYAKSVIEPCRSSDFCSSLLSYLLPFDSKISEISSRFQVNITDVLAANSINPTLPFIENQILPAKSLVKVPISCPCIDGIRRSRSTIYTVRLADSVDSIANGYGGLVSEEQIRSINGINAKKPLMSGEEVVIPLPCTCFNNSNNGVAAVYLSYVVQKTENLGSIGARYGTTVNELQAVNGLGQLEINPGDILAIPILACSSANLNWYNESLIVPNGSYTLTGNNCIRCNCEPSSLKLQCLPSGVVASCSHLQCKGSSLFIGEIYEQQIPNGCNIIECVYRGHNGGKIFRSLVNSSQVPCTGNYSYGAISPLPSASPLNPMVPMFSLSPSPSPSSVLSNPSMGADDQAPTSKQNSNSSSNARSNSQALSFRLVLVELAFYLIF